VAKRPPSRAQLRRNDRDDVENHPAGLVAAAAEGLHHFQALRVLEPLLQRALVLHLLAQLNGQAIGVDALEQFLDGLGTHHGFEASRTVLLVEFAELGFVLDDLALFHGSIAGLDHHVSLEIKHGFEIAQRDIEQVPDAAGQALEEPHVRAGRSQLDVSQALAADFRKRDFNAAFVADHAPMLHALVFAAQALPVGYGAEDAGAEQAVPLRLEGAVVDGLGLGHFAMGPAPDFFRRGQADADGIEIRDGVLHLERARTKQGAPPLPALERYRVPSTYRVPSFCVPRFESCHARNASSSNLPKSAPSLEVSLPARYSVLGTRYWVLPLVCCRAGRGLFLPGLDQLYVEAERLQFADQHVERFRHARLHGSFALDDGLVNLGATVNVVGLRRQ
jgi:hypothetical protein